MTRLFTDGAEMGDLMSIPLTSISFATVLTADSTTKRSGSYAYKLISNNSTNQSLVLIYTHNAINEVYFRFGLNTSNTDVPFTVFIATDNTTPIVQLSLGAKILNAYVNGSLVASGTLELANNTWYLVEVHFKMADSGIIQSKINGVLDINYSGDTTPGAETTFNRTCFGFLNASFRYTNTFVDDIAINDTSGATDNSWCGDGRVIALTPNANGDSSQFVGSDTNSTDNYLLVDEVPSDGDTSYVESATVGEKDLYNLTACGLTSVNIARVWIESRAKDTTTGDGTIKLLAKTESTEYESANIDLSTSYAAQKGTDYTVNPNTSAAWTTTQLDALQVGIKVVD